MSDTNSERSVEGTSTPSSTRLIDTENTSPETSAARRERKRLKKKKEKEKRRFRRSQTPDSGHDSEATDTEKQSPSKLKRLSDRLRNRKSNKPMETTVPDTTDLRSDIGTTDYQPSIRNDSGYDSGYDSSARQTDASSADLATRTTSASPYTGNIKENRDTYDTTNGPFPDSPTRGLSAFDVREKINEHGVVTERITSFYAGMGGCTVIVGNTQFTYTPYEPAYRRLEDDTTAIDRLRYIRSTRDDTRAYDWNGKGKRENGGADPRDTAYSSPTTSSRLDADDIANIESMPSNQNTQPSRLKPDKKVPPTEKSAPTTSAKSVPVATDQTSTALPTSTDTAAPTTAAVTPAPSQTASPSTAAPTTAATTSRAPTMETVATDTQPPSTVPSQTIPSSTAQEPSTRSRRDTATTPSTKPDTRDDKSKRSKSPKKKDRPLNKEHLAYDGQSKWDWLTSRYDPDADGDRRQYIDRKLNTKAAAQNAIMHRYDMERDANKVLTNAPAVNSLAEQLTDYVLLDPPEGRTEQQIEGYKRGVNEYIDKTAKNEYGFEVKSEMENDTAGLFGRTTHDAKTVPDGALAAMIRDDTTLDLADYIDAAGDDPVSRSDRINKHDLAGLSVLDHALQENPKSDLSLDDRSQMATKYLNHVRKADKKRAKKAKAKR